MKHRQNSKAQRKLEQPEYFNLVQEKFLTENWSPEQISARLKLEKSELSISYSTIYRGIYSGLFDIGERKTSRKLRHKGKTRHTKNHHEKRGKIQISNHLNDRPISAQNRSRFGHWKPIPYWVKRVELVC